MHVILRNKSGELKKFTKLNDYVNFFLRQATGRLVYYKTDCENVLRYLVQEWKYSVLSKYVTYIYISNVSFIDKRLL